MFFDCGLKDTADSIYRNRQSTISLSQIESHFVARLESQGFIEMAAVFAGVQVNASEAFALAPGDHCCHQLAGDAAPAKAGFGIDIENRRTAAFEVVGMSGPRGNDHSASGNGVIAGARQPGPERALWDRSPQVGGCD